MIPNVFLQSPAYSCDEKVLFSLIAMCGDRAFPSYTKLMKWSGLSRDRVWKCLKRLEDGNAIQRVKKGQKVYYFTWWNTSPRDGLVDEKPVRTADYTGPCHGLEPVRTADSNYTTEQELLTRELNFDFLKSIPKES